MIFVPIITRRLKPGKTYADFRRAWYHTVGFGMPSKFYTMINPFDPQEITVISFVDFGSSNEKELLEKFRIDIKERLEHSLAEVIEPDIKRSFGLLVAEDDFSAAGALEYTAPTVSGKEINLEEFAKTLQMLAKTVSQAAKERDQATSE